MAPTFLRMKLSTPILSMMHAIGSHETTYFSMKPTIWTWITYGSKKMEPQKRPTLLQTKLPGSVISFSNNQLATEISGPKPIRLFYMKPFGGKVSRSCFRQTSYDVRALKENIIVVQSLPKRIVITSAESRSAFCFYTTLMVIFSILCVFKSGSTNRTISYE